MEIKLLEYIKKIFFKLHFTLRVFTYGIKQNSSVRGLTFDSYGDNDKQHTHTVSD